MPKRLFVISNPRSGTGSAESSFEELNEALKRSGLSFIVKTVKAPDEAKQLALGVNPKFDAIAVHAGDGTVIAVVEAASQMEIPVLILPGGTANVIARDLELPLKIEDCLRLFAEDHFVIRYLGVAEADGEPLILDLHFGIWAEALPEVHRKHKKRWGQLAYYWGSLSQLRQAKPFKTELIADGQKHIYESYACIVANEGYQNVLGLRLFPREHGRGLVQVAIVRSLSLVKLITWFLVRVLTGRNLSSVIKMLRAREVIINQATDKIIIDDETRKVKLPLKIKATPARIKMIAPARSSGGTIQNWRIRFKVGWYRLKDHLMRLTTGAPSEAASQISPHLYLGGQYRRSAWPLFRRWGITAVVNMRRVKPFETPDWISVLHLPTPDHHAPTLAALRKGSIFIQDQINSGGSVYVHCRLGEGRGPTMAAAYLISQGMRPQDAVAHLERFRLFVRPNQVQMRQLARWADELARKPISAKPST